MNPEFIDGMSWEMAEVYGAVTDQILINLAHYFPYWKQGENLPKSAFEYQANMLAQMGQVNKDTVRLIRRSIVGSRAALQKVLEQAIIESVSKSQPELLNAVKQGILKPAGLPIVTPTQTRAFTLYYNQAADKLNLVNTVMLESTQQAYQATVADIVNRIQATQTALDIGAGETITGVSSWNQAMQHAISRMKRDGITGFIDHGGHRWSAESYVAMDIRTTVANTARASMWETNQTFGNDLYQVSYHNGARPLCYPWQNKVISSTDNARTTVDIDGNEIQVYAQSDTTYGQPAGLFGINCKHYPSPFIPGVSIIRGQPQDEEANAKTYAESQEQRRLERRAREEKRDLMMLKAQGAPDDVIAAQRERVRAASSDIQDFCDQTGRARHRDREGVYTDRRFPAADTYNVAEFERKQKETIDKYFGGGGSQQGYTFGQMTANAPLPVKNVVSQATTNATTADTIRGKTDKLKGSMSATDYDAVVGKVDKSEAVKLYGKYGDACNGIRYTRGGGCYRTGSDTVEYSFAPHPGMDKYSVMAHEMGHMFDAHIGKTSTLTFNEVDVINRRCVIGSGSIKLLKAVPSSSDKFLAAMRKDKESLRQLLTNAPELQRMKTGTWRNATAGIQDAMDGFFDTQDKYVLPWGHGGRYYNRQYNSRVKGFGVDKELKAAYAELGMEKRNQAEVKKQYRDYETASELWANVISAITCGGEELDAFKTYMPETLDAALSIIRGL